MKHGEQGIDSISHFDDTGHLPNTVEIGLFLIGFIAVFCLFAFAGFAISSRHYEEPKRKTARRRKLNRK